MNVSCGFIASHNLSPARGGASLVTRRPKLSDLHAPLPPGSQQSLCGLAALNRLVKRLQRALITVFLIIQRFVEFV